jgi:hypothetical protein
MNNFLRYKILRLKQSKRFLSIKFPKKSRFLKMATFPKPFVDNFLPKTMGRPVYLFNCKALLDINIENNFTLLKISKLKSSPIKSDFLSFYRSLTPYYWLQDFHYKEYIDNTYIRHKVLLLNFYKKGFFPVLSTLSGRTYINSSLGMFARFFNKGKSFVRKKFSFLVSASYLRKILVYSSVTDLLLIVKKIPLYFAEIMSTLQTPGIPLYDHPFTGQPVDEMLIFPEFRFRMFLFFNNKNYGVHKTKTRGRLKRKIARRLFKLNNILD